ncbi:MAG: tyrosine-protein phosphatase [Candidatus Izemoplasmatales bacterium]
MIDIHTHILPFIDDGSKTLEESIQLLEEEQRIGVTDVFLTPHYIKHRNYLSTYQENKAVFENFVNEVKKRDIHVNLHLGNEVYYHFDSVAHLRNQTVVPMGSSKFVLIEFSTSEEEEDIGEAIHNMKALGYTPIIAHIERYSYIKNFKDYELIKRMGAYIQVNASSVTGSSGSQYKKLAFKLIKAGLVDFIASDIHTFRKNELSQAYELVSKKFGIDKANYLFHNEIILK